MSMLQEINWHGWTPESGMSKAEYFSDQEIDRKCLCPCKRCGFNYLDQNGGSLKKPNAPLCGVW